jgi:hypothetical protein
VADVVTQLRVGKLPGGKLLNRVPRLDGRRFVVSTTCHRQGG